MLPFFKISFQLPPEIRPNQSGVPGLNFLTEISDDDLRKILRIVPAVEHRLVIQSLLCRPGCFNRRSGGAQNQQGPVPGAKVLGNVPCVIPGRIFRVVAALLLFVQDDDTQVLQRGKDGGAGAQHHTNLPTPDTLPLIIALRHTKSAVEHGHILSKIGGKFPHHLGCQHNLRHQDNGGSPLGQYLLNQLQIDLGLSAAGNALQQCARSLSRLYQPTKLVKGLLLFHAQLDWRSRLHCDRQGDA